MAVSPTKERKDGWLVLVIVLGLTIMIWTVFAKTLRYDFVNYDDASYVYANPMVRNGISPGALKWAFTHVHSQNWHPLTTISHMVDSKFYGLRAGGHHFTNVLLHTLAAIGLFMLLWQMTSSPSSPQDESVRLADRTGIVWRSAFVAAIFAIHPLHVESVAWVAERKDVLSGVFFVLILGAYARYAYRPSLGWYLAVVIFFALGLMSKPMLVSVPLILLLLDYWPLELARPRAGKTRRPEGRPSPTWMRLVIEKIPLFLLSAASCVATVLAQRQAIGTTEQLPLSWRFNNAVVSYLIYVQQMFWPAKLAVFYPHPENHTPIWQIVSAGAFLLGMTALCFAIRKRCPYALTGWLWYLIMLLPVIGIFQVGLQGHADRYTYLPQIGLYIFGTWLIADLTSRWGRRGIFFLAPAGAIMIVILAFAASTQASYWRNSETLWNHALEVTARNDMAHAGLAGILFGEGKIDEAIWHFEEALRIRPDNAEAHAGLADALQKKGNIVDAIAHWQRSLELEPENVTARDALGAALIQEGRLGEAIAQWQESVRFDPNDGNALSNLAWVWSTAPQPSIRKGVKAIEYAERALQLSGGKNPLIFRTLAAAYAESGRFSDAAATAKHAMQLALDQGNIGLADELRASVTLYEANSPLRDPSLGSSAP